MPLLRNMHRLLLLLILFMTVNTVARAGSYTNSTGATVDGGTVSQDVTASNEGSISNVVVSITFRKLSGSCPSNSDLGAVFNEEIFFALQSPSGTMVTLVNYGSYSGATDGGQVTVTFTDAAATTVSGTPTSGSFRPDSPLSAFNGENGNGTWTLTAGDNAAGDPLCLREWTLTLERVQPPATPASAPCPVFFDGRINDCDTFNPVVVYGHEYQTGRGLLILDTQGTELLQARPEDIAAVPECPDVNTMIASGSGVALYRLAGSCEFQVNALMPDNKTYVLIFDDLYPTGYRSYDMEGVYVFDERGPASGCPATDTLIASGQGVTVVHLAGSCRYQVNIPQPDGRTLVLIFDELADTGYAP